MAGGAARAGPSAVHVNNRTETTITAIAADRCLSISPPLANPYVKALRLQFDPHVRPGYPFAAPGSAPDPRRRRVNCGDRSTSLGRMDGTDREREPATQPRSGVWKRAIGLVAAIQLAIPLGLLGCKNSLLFHPRTEPTTAEGLPLLTGTDSSLMEVTRPDGRRLTGYDARPLGSAATPVLLYFHGNAGNAAGRAPWLRGFVRDSGLRIVLASYSGYGGNEGSPSEDDLYADALAFHDALTASGVPASQIVVYGESIGGGPASYVATERECAGLILQSTLASLSSMASEVYPWLPLTGLFTAGDFPNAERAAQATESMPVLVVHGTKDGIVPFSEGEAIHEAAPKSEMLPIFGADHNDLYRVGGIAYVKTIADRVRTWTSEERR